MAARATVSATAAGTSSGVIFGALNNQGLYNVTKIGVGLLQLGDNTSTFTNGTFTVDAGTVRVTSNGSFGPAYEHRHHRPGRHPGNLDEQLCADGDAQSSGRAPLSAGRRPARAASRAAIPCPRASTSS